MAGPRVSEVVQLALQIWAGRLAWVLCDREDNDYLYFIGVDACTEDDARQAILLMEHLTPADDADPTGYYFRVMDASDLDNIAG